MTTRSRESAMVEQGALFGDPVTIAAEDTRAGQPAATQDIELVASVVRLAQDPGYRVVERSGRVLRVDGSIPGAVEDVPRYEADALTQLLDAGVLDLGGNHTVTYRGNTGPARSVLVPKRTRDMVGRWAHLRPLPIPAARTTPPAPDHQDGQPSTGPIVVDVIRPGRGLLTCAEFSGELVRENGRYLVEAEGGQVVGRASSYRHGAELLARHHGYRLGPIEIDRSEEGDGNAPPPRTARDRQLGR